MSGNNVNKKKVPTFNVRISRKSNGTMRVVEIAEAGKLSPFVQTAESVLETIKLGVDASDKGKYAIHLGGQVALAAKQEIAAIEEAKKANTATKADKEAAAAAATANRVKLETEFKQVQQQAEAEVTAVIKKLEEEKEQQSITSQFRNIIGKIITGLKIVGNGLASPFRSGGKRHTNKRTQKKTHRQTHRQ